MRRMRCRHSWAGLRWERTPRTRWGSISGLRGCCGEWRPMDKIRLVYESMRKESMNDVWLTWERRFGNRQRSYYGGAGRKGRKKLELEEVTRRFEDAIVRKLHREFQFRQKSVRPILWPSFQYRWRWCRTAWQRRHNKAERGCWLRQRRWRAWGLRNSRRTSTTPIYSEGKKKKIRQRTWIHYNNVIRTIMTFPRA